MFYILFVINMEKTNGSITSEYMGGTREEFLFTYNESERQENEVNKNNASLLFKPKYIIFRPHLLQEGLSINETLVYCFIDNYLRDSSDKFYFTNEQIGNIFGFGEQNTSLIIKKLKEKGFIETCYKLKANGGKIRFIKNLYSDYKNFYSPTINNFIDNNNKINNNKKINNSKTLTLNNLESRLANVSTGDLTFTENVIERLNEYNNTRKKKLEKLTDKGFKLVIDKLVELGHGTEDGMIAVLKQSVEKGREGLFEVKGYKPKVDYENNLQLFLTRLKTDYEGLKKEVGTDKFFELKQKALEYGAANKLL